MRTAITASALAAGLWLAAAAPALAAYELYVTIEGVSQGEPGLRKGRLAIEIEERGGRLRGDLEQEGRTVHRELPFATEGCRSRMPEEWRGGKATIRKKGRGWELRVRHPEVAGCFLVGRIPPNPSAGGRQSLTGEGEPVPGGRPNPGGPIQGDFAAQVYPDLLIHTAEPVPGAPTQLHVDVRNAGPGPAGSTRLRLYYTTAGGEVATATAQVPALVAGGQAWVKIDAGKPLAAAKEVKVRVDDPNKLSETDELNNAFVLE